MSQVTPAVALRPRSAAILLGGPGDAPGFEPAQHDAICWLVDAAGALLPLATAPEAVVHTLILDGRTPADVLAALDRFRRRDPFRVPRLFVSRSFAVEAGGRHADLLSLITAWCERQQSEQALLQRVGFARQKNFLLNVPDYLRRRVPAAWAGALRGLPAFVCGPGESLEVSITRLAAVADRGVVLAADAALRTLARYGIAADLAVSLSSRKLPEHCVMAGAEPSRVVISTMSPASWRETIPADRVLFLSRAHPTEDWLGDQGVAPAAIEAAESCSLTVLELARFLGCAPIYLFGIDLALDQTEPPGGDCADAAARGEGAGLPATLPQVPGNYQPGIATLWQADWAAHDARLAAWPADLVFNVNDRGARLRNTRLIQPAQFNLTAAGHVLKRPALAQLAAPCVTDADAAQRALAAIGAQGARGCRVVAALRVKLEQRGRQSLAQALGQMLQDRDAARALGSYAQKILPHLVAADASETAWSVILDELEELCCLAEAVYGVPVA